jgi:glycosidase
MANHFDTISWAKNAVIYEVNIRQYTPEGTFKAFENHLQRIANMGINIIWLMPITPISLQNRQGTLGSYYACSSYTKINPEFGNEANFASLVAKAHSLGLKIIVDWVANHTGCDNEWTITNKDYYALDNENNFTERNGWKDVFDLNYNNINMQNAMINAMQYWVKTFDIDGFRCDMAHLVSLEFWAIARTQIDATKKLFWLAETETDNYNNVFDVTYAWAWMHASEDLRKKEQLMHNMYNVLHNYSQQPKGSKKMLFTANHDENSWNGTEYLKYGKAAKAFAVFTFTWQNSMPLIYSGQEAANKKQLHFFDKDEIIWQNPPVLQNFYTTLSQLHATEIITNGSLFILPTANNICAFLRILNNEKILIILNFSDADQQKVSISHPNIFGNFINIFSQLSYTFSETETFELMGGDYLVFKNI